MNNKKINQTIKDYKSHKGFYDLSKKPKTLNKKEYAKVLEIQEFLIEQNNNIEYLRKFNPIQYEDDKEVSARLQMIIKENWNI